MLAVSPAPPRLAQAGTLVPGGPPAARAGPRRPNQLESQRTDRVGAPTPGAAPGRARLSPPHPQQRCRTAPARATAAAERPAETAAGAALTTKEGEGHLLAEPRGPDGENAGPEVAAASAEATGPQSVAGAATAAPRCRQRTNLRRVPAATTTAPGRASTRTADMPRRRSWPFWRSGFAVLCRGLRPHAGGCCRSSRPPGAPRP